MKSLITSVGILINTAAIANVTASISKQEYIDNWSTVAVEQMVRYKIPASITLAQGILESANGNSKLAISGNNHFGIKCHGWEGKVMYIDDDKDNECFRVYKTAEESFIDHSEFLTKYTRYAFLFDYDTDDYKAWAKGLKTAGYATNPNYPELLIDIIEDLELNRYDKLSRPLNTPQPHIVENKSTNRIKHQVNVHSNGIKYVVAKRGDTFYTLSKEFGLKLSQLYRYNDFSKTKDVIVPGDVIYLQPKKRRSLFKKEEIIIEKDISIIELSQQYGTNIKSIMRLNNYNSDQDIIAKGNMVTLH